MLKRRDASRLLRGESVSYRMRAAGGRRRRRASARGARAFISTGAAWLWLTTKLGSDQYEPSTARDERAPSPLDDELAQLAEEHAESIYRVAVSIVRDPGLAEDVVQETLMKVWRGLPTFRGEANIRRWILRIAHNTAVSVLRVTREQSQSPDTLPDRPTTHTVEETAHNRLAIRRLWDALGRLDAATRAIVVLRDVEGLSYDEVAKALNLPLPTVKTRLFRARRSLAVELEGWRA
jgi:RNA polymerase sigma-70 factor (ECF subfamily)